MPEINNPKETFDDASTKVPKYPNVDGFVEAYEALRYVETYADFYISEDLVGSGMALVENSFEMCKRVHAVLGEDMKYPKAKDPIMKVDGEAVAEVFVEKVIALSEESGAALKLAIKENQQLPFGREKEIEVISALEIKMVHHLREGLQNGEFQWNPECVMGVEESNGVPSKGCSIKDYKFKVEKWWDMTDFSEDVVDYLSNPNNREALRERFPEAGLSDPLIKFYINNALPVYDVDFGRADI